MAVSHDDAILDPILAFQVESVRIVTVEEGIELSAGNNPKSRLHLLGGLPLRDTALDPFRVRAFFHLVSSQDPSTGTMTERSNIVIREISFKNLDLSTSLAPDWEDVARHNSSDCYAEELLDSPEARMGCRRKHAINAFLVSRAEILSRAGSSALSIYSPNESPLKFYRTHALILTIRAAPSFAFDKPSYRILDAVVKPHSVATSLIVNGIDGRETFLPDKYYEKVDPAFKGKPRDSVMFKAVIVEEGGKFRHVIGINAVAPNVSLYKAARVAPDPKWKATLMKAINGGDGSSGFELPPSLPSRSPPCGGCPSPVDTVNLKRCSRCKKQTYCTESCQKRDWKRHKLECVPA
ncbi:hypothetical protein RQP46_001968 [Phenoliferia psychrophenolica]